MTLATHTIIGAATARLFPNHPVLAFGIAFGSHFVADALPHWDYHILSFRRDRQNPLNNDMDLHDPHIGSDLLRIGLDALLGLGLSLLIFSTTQNYTPFIIFLGTVGGTLPDALQFAYWKIRREPLRSLQRFHQWVHTRIRLRGKPILGSVLQLLLVSMVVWLSIFILN